MADTELTCPVCGSADNKLFKQIRSTNIHKCKKCKAYFNQSGGAALQDLYNNPDYFLKTHNINPENIDVNAAKKIPIIKLIQGFCSNKESINYIEIGPGDGSLAKAAMNIGWNVRVFDTSDFIVTELGKAGIRAESVNYFYDGFKDKADIIAMSHVLEHIHDPNILMNKLAAVHSKKGILYLAFPNTGSLDRRYHGDKWTGWDIPYHVIHYSLKSIAYLLTIHEYEIIYTDSTYFNFLKHILAGLRNKDLFGDYRKDLPILSVEKYFESTEQTTPEFEFPSPIRRFIKRVLSERNITVIARKR